MVAFGVPLRVGGGRTLRMVVLVQGVGFGLVCSILALKPFRSLLEYLLMSVLLTPPLGDALRGHRLLLPKKGTEFRPLLMSVLLTPPLGGAFRGHRLPPSLIEYTVNNTLENPA